MLGYWVVESKVRGKNLKVIEEKLRTIRNKILVFLIYWGK